MASAVSADSDAAMLRSIEGFSKYDCVCFNKMKSIVLRTYEKPRFKEPFLKTDLPY